MSDNGTDDTRAMTRYLCGLFRCGEIVVLRLSVLLFAVWALTIGGCGSDYSPNTYTSNAVQQANKVDKGVIVGVRQVAVSAKGSVGGITGAATGGVAGSQLPGIGSALGAIGGTVIGGIVGTSVEQATADTTAFEYIVQKSGGELISVTQKDEKPMPVGHRVLVIAGPQARIVADYTVGPAAVPLPPGLPATLPDLPRTPDLAPRLEPPRKPVSDDAANTMG